MKKAKKKTISVPPDYVVSFRVDPKKIGPNKKRTFEKVLASIDARINCEEVPIRTKEPKAIVGSKVVGSQRHMTFEALLPEGTKIEIEPGFVIYLGATFRLVGGRLDDVKFEEDLF